MTAEAAPRPSPCCPPTAAAAPLAAGDPPRVARVALVGNPNVGKSTLFNAITGARQRVGNWPGKTVHVASGWWSTPAGPVEVVDLPGTYSLVARSPDEELVRDLIVDPAARQRPDVVVVVLDAANLTRNLYLLAQVLDTGVPIAAALTMSDVAAARGVRVDAARLGRQLGIRVVPVHGRTGAGLDRLADAVLAAAGGRPAAPVRLDEPVERAIGSLTAALAEWPDAPPSARWLAISLLTGTPAGVPDALAPAVAGLRPLAATAGGDNGGGDGGDGGGDDNDLETTVADARYGWIRRVVSASVDRPQRSRPTASDRADRVLTGRWVGMPIFLLVMWGVFEATTRLAAPLQDGLAALIDGPVVDGTRWLLSVVGLDGSWLAALIIDGLVSGVGQLLTFTPLMVIMFVLLTLLEDSGYLARAAFVADRFLRLVGLPGHAFLPLIVGFGCNVPAVAGTRILANARHRLMTVLLVPFVTCTARLTVYVLLANVFFGRAAGTVIFAMYLLSTALVIGAGVALRHTLLRRQPADALLLELPPYRRPVLKVVVTQSWQRLLGFLRTAGGIIVLTVTAVWLLTAIPLDPGRGGEFGAVEPAQSWYAGASRAVAPVFAPAGFADWHAGGALITGFVAKEAVVTTFAQTYGAAEPADPGRAGDGLATKLRETFETSSDGHPQAAVLAFLVFLLAYTPCMATLAAQRVEIGARWTAIGVGVQFTVAWLLATVVFQVGRLIT